MPDFDFAEDDLVLDRDAATRSGAWLDIGNGVSFLVTLADVDFNPRYRGLVDKLIGPHRNSIRNNGMDPEKLRQIWCRIYGMTIVQDWKGVNDRTGNPVPFSPVACEAYLKAREIAYRRLADGSSEIANFRKAAIEVVTDQAKNV